MGNGIDLSPAQYFEVLSIPATPPHLRRQGKVNRSICLSIVKISNESEPEHHKIMQWDIQSSIGSVTFDRKLENVWIFFHHRKGGIGVLPLCIRMDRQIQTIPPWVKKISESKRGPFGTLPIIHSRDEQDILVEELSSDGVQGVMKYKHKSNAVSISFLDGKYEIDAHQSLDSSTPKSEHAISYTEGDFPNICPGHNNGEIMDDEIIPKRCLEELSKLPPHVYNDGTPKWWGWLRWLYDDYSLPLFVHPITAENAEEQLKKSQRAEFINNTDLSSNEEDNEMSQNCEKHSVSKLLVDGEWECPFCVAESIADVSSEFVED